MIDDMAVYIANLGKYNEGYLVGAWFTFPIDEEDVKEKIGKTYCEVSFYPVRKCEYCHEAVEVTPGTTGYDVMQRIKELLAERPAYQYFRICLQGYKDPDVIFDLNKLSNLERIVNVIEQLRPDYDYEKLLAEHENSLLGAYIAAMQKKRQDPVAAKALEYGVSALLGHEICR